MVTKTEVESFIKIIRESFDDSVKVYTQGSCLKFSMILEYVFPGGEILWDEDHSLYELNGICYDINGEQSKGEFHKSLKENYSLCEIYKLLSHKYKKK